MKRILLSLILLSFLTSCNKGVDPDELRAKSTARGDIIARSGTAIIDENDALVDAQNRLRTGGGLFGKKPMGLDLFDQDRDSSQSTSIGMPINAVLWKSALEVVSFMPIASADAFGGIIITDWYSQEANIKERCKLNVFIRGMQLRSENIKVKSFCQTLDDNNNWVYAEQIQENNNQIENAILNKAKKIKLSSN
tara:strand:+ start:108 stop:689 length:582 start_codon:yes stop_codon:yes gene_type:complete